MTWGLLPDNDPGLAILSEEVVVHSPVLVTLNVHQPQPGLVHCLTEASHVVTILALMFKISVISTGI